MNVQHQFQQAESGEALALGTEPIPAGPYYRDDYFDLEREAIFRRTWLNIGARKSRGVIRIYWVGDDMNASERFGREFSMAMARDVHSEDRAVIEAGQRGLNSGALKHIHFQSQEVLLRHLMHHVNAKVQAYQAELASAADKK
jgi:Ring hydroxylating alpha subunit (catalytic domain)